MVNNVAIVTVRNSSKRLPKKPFMKIKKELKAIDIIIKRAKKTNMPVILTTSKHKEDDPFVEVAKKYQVSIFRGALLNKIKRWYDCFDEYNVDNALLVDGDDLAYDYNIGIRAISELERSHADIIMSPKDIACGFFTYALSKGGIAKLYKIANNESIDTDVIDKFIEKANLKISYVSLENHERNGNVRLTLDYPEDLEFFRRLYNDIDILTNGKNIISYLENNKKISQINFHRQKDFLENQAQFNENLK